MAFEANLWGWMRDFHAPDLHQERVENAVGNATPDVEGQIGVSHYHLELKVLRDKSVSGKDDIQGRLKFEVGQREWGQKRWSVGGTSYLVVEGFSQDIYMIPGAFLLTLPRLGMVKTRELQALSWWYCEKKNPEIRAALYGALRKSAAAHRWVDERFRLDPQLLAASLPPAVHPALSGSAS